MGLVSYIAIQRGGMRYVSWLRRNTTGRKVAGSSSDEIITYFSIYLILLAALGPGVYSSSNRNEYQKLKNNVSGE
jgi:hypothetical protein